ncbi:LysR family transcriptional regulator [Tanticharoenia sakaeratensis]|uniref:Transcriptional regulator LysR n=1 Tax=Tanticharoenia sakaeratensis NBRC 103193 TaxID=1231623 RepID=A0A0D6MLC6_9PROT|nr:LysR family transcriptional regulator [Tanticharoenia sakaeratensis]GAN54108.1 transcriptional regulator LysR [Tanticharoenia sakaeratensis NBRC 103193]GBQ24685.1 LysR family transcriptional regulator [Tanticharoenia sakaeratensis NBRC 103193]
MAVFSRFLRYFVAVARYGSIRRASDELRIAASAIDRQILHGEQTIGTPLFERLPSGLRLTAAGELLLAAANRWSRDMENLTVQIDDMKGLRQGKVDLLIPEALTKGFVPSLLGRLRTTHPGIVVNVSVRDNRDIADLLIGGEADLALVLDPPHRRELVVRGHRAFPLGFIARPDHPIAARAEARFSLCAEFPMVVPAAPLALRRQLELLEIETQVRLRPAASADNIQMIKSLVMEGVGIGILSRLDAFEEIAQGLLAFVPIANSRISPLTLALCIDRARQLSAAAQLILQEIEKTALAKDDAV